MTHTTTAPRVLVVGAGVLGVSTATALARRGASVTLVTEAAASSGASGRSLSWLNSAGPRSDDYHLLRTLGIDRYRTLAARHPGASFLRFDGGLTWAAPGASYRDRYEHERTIGYDTVWLSPEEVAAWTPGVNAGAVAEEGAVFNPGEGWVELPLLIEHLLREFRAAGGFLQEGVGKVTVQTSGGRASGVRTASGAVLEADAVVLATGPSVPADLARFGIEIPDATPISLLVRTKPVDVPLRAVLNTPRVAVRPTAFGTLVLDSAWSEEEVVARGDGTYEIQDSTVRGLLREASHVLAGEPELELDGWGVGPKPIPGDGEPVAGGLEQVPGLHVLFTHSGATLGLILGELTANEVLTGTASPLLQSFRPSRFAARLATV
jgi:glycine/D-amino acid oxidase-like deaminating enzyme